jgi:hypothetical protein
MKISYLLVLSSLVFVNSAHAADCKSVPERLIKLSEEIQFYNGSLRVNYQSRLSFTSDLYEELAANEGRSLYIPFGTYDSVKRSISKEQYNTNDVIAKTRAFDAQLKSITDEIKNCL